MQDFSLFLDAQNQDSKMIVKGFNELEMEKKSAPPHVDNGLKELVKQMEKSNKEKEKEKNSHLEQNLILKQQNEELKVKIIELDKYKQMHDDLVERIKDR